MDRDEKKELRKERLVFEKARQVRVLYSGSSSSPCCKFSSSDFRSSLLDP